MNKIKELLGGSSSKDNDDTPTATGSHATGRDETSTGYSSNPQTSEGIGGGLTDSSGSHGATPGTGISSYTDDRTTGTTGTNYSGSSGGTSSSTSHAITSNAPQIGSSNAPQVGEPDLGGTFDPARDTNISSGGSQGHYTSQPSTLSGELADRSVGQSSSTPSAGNIAHVEAPFTERKFQLSDSHPTFTGNRLDPNFEESTPTFHEEKLDDATHHGGGFQQGSGQTGSGSALGSVPAGTTSSTSGGLGSGGVASNLGTQSTVGQSTNDSHHGRDAALGAGALGAGGAAYESRNNNNTLSDLTNRDASGTGSSEYASTKPFADRDVNLPGSGLSDGNTSALGTSGLAGGNDSTFGTTGSSTSALGTSTTAPGTSTLGGSSTTHGDSSIPGVPANVFADTGDSAAPTGAHSDSDAYAARNQGTSGVSNDGLVRGGDDTTSSTTGNQSHLGRDAAIGGATGLGAAGAYKAYEDHKENQTSSSGLAGTDQGTGSSGLLGRSTGASGLSSSSGNNTLGSGSNTTGVGSDSAAYASRNQGSSGLSNDGLPRDGGNTTGSSSHVGRDVGLASAAGVGGAAAYEAVEHRRDNTTGTGNSGSANMLGSTSDNRLGSTTGSGLGSTTGTSSSTYPSGAQSSTTGYASGSTGTTGHGLSSTNPADNQTSSSHLGRDAALGAGAGGAAYEAEKRHSEKEHAPAHTLQHHREREAESREQTKGGPLGFLHKNQKDVYDDPAERDTTAREKYYGTDGVTHTLSSEQRGDYVPREAQGTQGTSTSHLGRDAALGAGAVGVGGAAYEAGSNNNRLADLTGRTTDPSTTHGTSSTTQGTSSGLTGSTGASSFSHGDPTGPNTTYGTDKHLTDSDYLVASNAPPSGAAAFRKDPISPTASLGGAPGEDNYVQDSGFMSTGAATTTPHGGHEQGTATHGSGEKEHRGLLDKILHRDHPNKLHKDPPS